jgi:hypothetical protein
MDEHNRIDHKQVVVGIDPDPEKRTPEEQMELDLVHWADHVRHAAMLVCAAGFLRQTGSFEQVAAGRSPPRSTGPAGRSRRTGTSKKRSTTSCSAIPTRCSGAGSNASRRISSGRCTPWPSTWPGTARCSRRSNRAKRCA